MSRDNTQFGIGTVTDALVDRRKAVAERRCVTPIGCGKPVTSFRDAVSEREYQISGLCQACQDKYFRDDDDNDPTL